MKRKIFALMLIGGFLFTTSCIKDEQTSPASLDTSKTATIKGLVRVQLDLLNDTLGLRLENAPAGTKITFRVNASQYVLNPSGTYDDLIFETTLNSSGEYSIEIPATNKGVNVSIIPDEFVYNQGQRKLQNGFWVADSPIRKKYSAGTYSINGLVSGTTKVLDFNYSDQ